VDVVDRANALVDAERDAALAAHQARPRPAGRLDADDGRCACCRERIPRARRLAVPDTSLCIDCASERERKQGRR
jgi:RNA polymerase-binding transcription factor DksA